MAVAFYYCSWFVSAAFSAASSPLWQNKDLCMPHCTAVAAAEGILKCYTESEALQASRSRHLRRQDQVTEGVGEERCVERMSPSLSNKAAS